MTSGLYNDPALTELMVNTSLVDVVAHKIRENILNGIYVPGQKLIVRELEAEMEVSQTPIKEALYRLVAEGYIDAIPRKSMVVRQVSYEQYEQNMEIRAMFELYAIPAVVAGSMEDSSFLEGMEQDLQQMAAVLSAEELDYREWLEHDGNFHNRYMSMVDNATMNDMYFNLKANRLSYFAFLDNTKHPLTIDHLRMDNEEHEEILQAFRNGNVAEISSAVTGHILRPRIPGRADSEARERIARLVRLYQRGGQ